MKRKTQGKKQKSDHVSTRDKILLAATKVFAEHGFRDATTRMICAEAGVNVALVNYYFRSKADLYKAVVASLFENTGKPLMALPDTVTDAASWQQAMRAWIMRSLAICAARKPPDMWVARLIGLESCVPSDVTQDIEEKFRKPLHQSFQRLLRMAMKTDDPLEVNLWASTISAQYMVYAFAKQGWATRSCPPGLSHDAWLERVADHICTGIFARLSFQ